MCDKEPYATINGLHLGKWGYRLFMTCLSLLAVIQVVVLYHLFTI